MIKHSCLQKAHCWLLTVFSDNASLRLCAHVQIDSGMAEHPDANVRFDGFDFMLPSQDVDLGQFVFETLGSFDSIENYAYNALLQEFDSQTVTDIINAFTTEYLHVPEPIQYEINPSEEGEEEVNEVPVVAVDAERSGSGPPTTCLRVDKLGMRCSNAYQHKGKCVFPIECQAVLMEDDDMETDGQIQANEVELIGPPLNNNKQKCPAANKKGTACTRCDKHSGACVFPSICGQTPENKRSWMFCALPLGHIGEHVFS